MQDILKFIVSFAEIKLPVGHIHKHRGHRVSPAAAESGDTSNQRTPALHKAGRGALQQGAAAAAPVEAAAAEIESQLHRQGLRNKATKGEMSLRYSITQQV
jgi:hypothetical protein